MNDGPIDIHALVLPPSHFGTSWLPSSYPPADFLWPRHTKCVISESGWLCTRQSEDPPQGRDLPAKFFDNNTLRITPLFARFCRESLKTAKSRHQNPEKAYITPLFVLFYM